MRFFGALFKYRLDICTIPARCPLDIRIIIDLPTAFLPSHLRYGKAHRCAALLHMRVCHVYEIRVYRTCYHPPRYDAPTVNNIQNVKNSLYMIT